MVCAQYDIRYIPILYRRLIATRLWDFYFYPKYNFPTCIFYDISQNPKTKHSKSCKKYLLFSFKKMQIISFFKWLQICLHSTVFQNSYLTLKLVTSFRSTQKPHLWTVKLFQRNKMSEGRRGREIMTTHEKKPWKFCCFLRPHSDPQQRKICSFMFHFPPATMAEFFFAFFGANLSK